jgi:hypothetical protein
LPNHQSRTPNIVLRHQTSGHRNVNSFVYDVELTRTTGSSNPKERRWLRDNRIQQQSANGNWPSQNRKTFTTEDAEERREKPFSAADLHFRAIGSCQLAKTKKKKTDPSCIQPSEREQATPP